MLKIRFITKENHKTSPDHQFSMKCERSELSLEVSSLKKGQFQIRHAQSISNQ